MPIASTAQLKGMTVLEAGGQVVGTLDELLVDMDSWTVAAIRLRVKREIAREIGAPGSIFQSALLEIPIEMVAAARDAVILSVPLATLRELARQKPPAPDNPVPPPSDQADPALP